VAFARPLVFFGADVFSDRQLGLEMESRARKIPSTKLVPVGNPIHKSGRSTMSERRRRCGVENHGLPLSL
jgi:hypothetical protein